MASTTPSTKAQADSTTTTPHPPTTDEKVHAASAAFNHFSQGKRHLLVGDFKSAVAAFKEATESLVKLYGEQAPECGDAYYHYGHALLELARKEAGVLGPDLDGASSQEGSTGEEEDEEEESEESQEEEEGGKKEEGEEEEEEDGEGKEKDKKGNAEEGEGENTEEEEEVTTLQCAWEWLDVARVIFDKQEETPEVVKKRAQIRLSLGEVCMESEDYEGAINEFKQCLQMQEPVLEKDDRSLAETHYQLGLVYSLSDNFDSAVSHYTAAVDVIQLKIKNLQARVTEKNSWSKERRDKDLAESKDVFYTEEGEIEDLQQLLPDIHLKIVDMKEMKAASVEKLQQAAKPGDIAAMLLGKGEGPGSSSQVFSQAREGEASGSVASSSKSSDAKPLMCQVRRKRKPEEDEATDEQKKPRLENGVKREGTEEQEEDKSKAASNFVVKSIAVKRKVAENGKESSAESSPAKAESSSSSKSESSSNSTESSLAPQEIK
ncbi:protein HGV2-like isoform X2 [Portunus trituberculatus]|uniref:protein HGV2-like isoform X2 n=1 Tax=Portunus trituberculatus TaxID=210409 RepID=UPI001E1CE183|nr:protein HGV2-like isoform X2 [Portunus trituberculatus]